MLVRKVDRDLPTLLLDETDAAFKGQQDYTEALRAILNVGYKRGGVASICVKQGGDFDLRDFGVFGPKALAGIGKLPDTVADRSIPIELRRKATIEVVERFRQRDAVVEAGPLREKMEGWATMCIPTLLQARPEIPEPLDDRAADVWEPLLAIADSAGGNWPTDARVAALALSSGDNREDESIGVILLKDVQDVLNGWDSGSIASRKLVEALVNREEAPWGDLSGKPMDARRLARMLKPYGIAPSTQRDGSSTFKGYNRADFTDAWGRYITPLEASHPSQRLQSLDSDMVNVTDVTDVTDKTGLTENDEVRI